MKTSKLAKKKKDDLNGDAPTIEERLETLDVIEISKGYIENTFNRPLSARPVLSNRRFKQMTEEIRRTGVIPGRLTVALDKNKKQYIIDGWHRLCCFELSNIDVALTEVKYIHVNGNKDMARLFLQINTPIRAVSVNDKLRALYGHHARFRAMVDDMRFLDFSRGNRSVLVSIPLQSWFASEKSQPTTPARDVIDMVEEFNAKDMTHFKAFVEDAYTAWGYDNEHRVLWARLNLTIMAWFYRRTYMHAKGGVTKLSRTAWRSIFRDVGNHNDYVSFLRGKTHNIIHLKEAYDRICVIIQAIPEVHENRRIKFPPRSWITPEEREKLNRMKRAQAKIVGKKKRNLKKHKEIMAAGRGGSKKRKTR